MVVSLHFDREVDDEWLERFALWLTQGRKEYSDGVYYPMEGNYVVHVIDHNLQVPLTLHLSSDIVLIHFQGDDRKANEIALDIYSKLIREFLKVKIVKILDRSKDYGRVD